MKCIQWRVSSKQTSENWDTWGLWRPACACESAQCLWSVVRGVALAWNPIVLNFAILISLFTQPVKFSDGQLVLSCSFQPPLFLIRQHYRRLSF